MTTTDDTPRQGHERTEIETNGDDWPPMMDEPNEEIALAVEDQKQQARDAADAVGRALLNDSVPLTDGKVHDLWKAADALTALSATLCHRVPEEHRVDRDAEPPYYED